MNSSQFLYSGDVDAMLLRGRLVIALFSLTLGFLVFVAAREMFNPLIALLALGLLAFEPVLLANGALVTTDMPLACLFFASVYTFYRYVKRPSLFTSCGLCRGYAVCDRGETLGPADSPDADVAGGC